MRKAPHRESFSRRAISLVVRGFDSLPRGGGLARIDGRCLAQIAQDLGDAAARIRVRDEAIDSKAGNRNGFRIDGPDRRRV
jgi:hypothetical protein